MGSRAESAGRLVSAEDGVVHADAAQNGEAQDDAVRDAGPALSPRDASILEFERQWWKHAGAKEEAIREKFGLSAARYYQILNAVLDLPAAIMSDPMLVKRLRRLRDSRTAARSARVVGTVSPRDSTGRSPSGRQHELNN